MTGWEPVAYKEYRWIVADPQLLGGVAKPRSFHKRRWDACGLLLSNAGR